MGIATSSDNEKSPTTSKEEAPKSSDQEEENSMALSLWKYNDIPMESSCRSKEHKSMEGKPSIFNVKRRSSHILNSLYSPENTTSQDLNGNLSYISGSHSSSHDLLDRSSVPPKKHYHAISIQSINEQTIKKYFRSESTTEREKSIHRQYVPQFESVSTQKNHSVSDFRPTTKGTCSRSTQVSDSFLYGCRGARMALAHLNRLRPSVTSDHDFPLNLDLSVPSSYAPRFANNLCLVLRVISEEDVETCRRNRLHRVARECPRRWYEHRVRTGRVLRRRTRHAGGRKPRAGRCRRRRPPPHTRPRIPRQRRHRSVEPLPRIKRRKKKRRLDDNENEPGARRRHFERPRPRSRRIPRRYRR